jgi:hypothetical protein
MVYGESYDTWYNKDAIEREREAREEFEAMERERQAEDEC